MKLDVLGLLFLTMSDYVILLTFSVRYFPHLGIIAILSQRLERLNSPAQAAHIPKDSVQPSLYANKLDSDQNASHSTYANNGLLQNVIRQLLYNSFFNLLNLGKLSSHIYIYIICK